MADVQSGTGTKKTPAAKAVAPVLPSKSSRVTMLSPSLLLLEIPADINTSLPVWQAVKAQKVGVTWTVNPYSIGVHLTPDAPKQNTSMDETRSTVVQTPLLSPQPPINQQHGSSENICMLLTFFQNPSVVCSVTVSLPLIIASSQQGNPSGTFPNTEVPLTIQSSTGVPNELPAGSKVAEPLSFHTRSSQNILICDDFLLGRCGAGLGCTRHHTPLPFHWQMWSTSDHRWVSLPDHSQVFVERSYCDANQENVSNVSLKDGQNCNITFLDYWDETCTVRRLANSDSGTKNPYFPSKLKMYWWNDYIFEEYKMDLSNMLVKKMSANEPVCSFHIGQQEYEVNFTTMMQTNISTGSQRKVRWRPAYRSPQSMQPYLKTGIRFDLSQPDSDPPVANFSVNPLRKFSSWYPPVWCETQEDYTLVDVPFGTQAYKTIAKLFYKSMTETSVDIISVQQVQNTFHWDKYQRQKAHMQKHNESNEPMEKHLFHGTTKEASESICCNNFDPRLDSVNGKTSHGHGTYFATTSQLSNYYTGVQGPFGVRHMFLAKVLVGRACLGNKHYCRPPPYNSKTQQHALYDSCVDRLENPKMFVVFDNCQCYPYYLIKYRERF